LSKELRNESRRAMSGGKKGVNGSYLQGEEREDDELLGSN